jgi:hypothetical protein
MIPRGFLDRLAAEHGVTKTSLTVRGGTTDPLRVDQWTNHTIAACSAGSTRRPSPTR